MSVQQRSPQQLGVPDIHVGTTTPVQPETEVGKPAAQSESLAGTSRTASDAIPMTSTESTTTTPSQSFAATSTNAATSGHAGQLPSGVSSAAAGAPSVSVVTTPTSTDTSSSTTTNSNSVASSSWSSSSSLTSSSPTSTSSSSAASSPSSTSAPAWTSSQTQPTTAWSTEPSQNQNVAEEALSTSSSTSWSSDWSQPSSSTSWTETIWTSSTTNQGASVTTANAHRDHSSSSRVDISGLGLNASPKSSVNTTSAEDTDSLTSAVNKAGTLTNSAHAVSSTGLITGKNGKSSAEAANGDAESEQTKKVAGMNVGAFVGLLLALLLAIVAAYFICDRWYKKKTGDSTPLWRRVVDKFMDKDPNDEKRPFNRYNGDPFADEMEKAPHKKKRVSSFFNSARSSRWMTPVTPLHQENLAGRGNGAFGWPAPPPPALTENNPDNESYGQSVPPNQHPRASRYMPTSGRMQQPLPSQPGSAIEPSRPESNEILANYYPDSDYETQDDGPTRFNSRSTKRKTVATTRSEGSVYSVDSIWGNASDMPPTARSSLHSSFLPWRRSNSAQSVAGVIPAVPAIPDRLGNRQIGRSYPSSTSRLSGFRKSSSYERLQDASDSRPGPVPAATRLPPRPAMAQTPVAVRQNPGFGEGGFVLPLGGFSR